MTQSNLLKVNLVKKFKLMLHDRENIMLIIVPSGVGNNLTKKIDQKYNNF